LWLEQADSFLQTLVLLCFLDSFSVFFIYNWCLVFKMITCNQSVRAKREPANNLALFEMSWLFYFIVKIAPFKSKVDVCVRYNVLPNDPLHTAYRLKTPLTMRTKRNGAGTLFYVGPTMYQQLLVWWLFL